MKIEDSKQIRKKLEKEYDANCSKIGDLKEKIQIISANDFETKIAGILVFSMISWIVSLFALPIVINAGFIPLSLVQPLFGGIPTLIGIVAEELCTRKSKYREKLRKFSNSKSQREKIEESTRYEVEKEKLTSLNKILKKGCENLLANENMIISLSTTYNITEKDNNNQTPEEINANIKNINDVLTKKEQDMNVATTKCVLKTKFQGIRDKSNNMFISCMLGGTICMLFYDIPMICLNQLLNIKFQPSLIGLLSPLIIGGFACGVYNRKRKNDLIAAFKNINEELDNNSISEFSDYEQDKQLDKDLETIIKDTCAIKLQLETEKQKLENISRISNSKSAMNEFMKKLDSGNLTYEQEPTIGKELVPNNDFINNQLESYKKLLQASIIGQNEEPEIKGPKLIKK